MVRVPFIGRLFWYVDSVIKMHLDLRPMSKAAADIPLP